jgi:hypothetical protein
MSVTFSREAKRARDRQTERATEREREREHIKALLGRCGEQKNKITSILKCRQKAKLHSQTTKQPFSRMANGHKIIHKILQCYNADFLNNVMLATHILTYNAYMCPN